MTCPVCVDAQTNPYTDEMRAGCVGCTDDEERKAFKTAVVAEFRRRTGKDIA